MPIYKVDENLNEGALSLALAAGITAAVIGAVTYSCVKHIKETKELDYILEHYAEYHDDAIDYDDLTCKNYYIKPFSLKLQKGKPMKNTKFLGITKNHIASFTYKNKPFMTCAYIDNSVSIGGTTVINIQVKCEFHDPIAKKHKEYYTSSFCRKRRLFIKNNSKWIKEEYKKLKENENLNEGAITIGALIGINVALIGYNAYNATKVIKHNKNLSYVLEQYPLQNKDVINFNDLECKNHSIKKGTESEAGEELDNIRGYGGLTVKDHVAVYSYKGKPFMSCVYTQKGAMCHFKAEYYHRIAKKHKDYYLTSFCKSRDILYSNDSVNWVKNQYKILKQNEK